MKKITNNSFFLVGIVTTLFACGSGDTDEGSPRTNEQILQEVREVHAVGKVVPAGDWAIIASPVAARVQRRLVQTGDTVAAGQLLLLLEPGNADLEVAEARARLMSLQAESRGTTEDLRKAELYAAELKAVYETSRRLLAQQAETRETAATDSSNWQQQESMVRALKEQIRAQRASENELSIQIQKAESQRTDFNLTAPAAGIITDLTAKVGQYVSGAEELGRIANPSEPIIEAEVDELFAADIRVGQAVVITAVGRPDTLARGRVSHASPVLADKSILYETANEGEDRRVRRIKIVPESNATLTVNAKVACTINIR